PYALISLYLNFLNPVLMSATFKCSIQESFNHLMGFIIRDKSSRETDDICIIMFTTKTCDFFIPAQCRTNLAMPVGTDGNSYSASTNNYPFYILVILNESSKRMHVIRIVHRGFGMSAKVLNIISFGNQDTLQFF